MADDNLPLRSPDWRYWHDHAPDPDSQPQFYEGVSLRRVIAYIVDVCFIALLLVAAWFAGGILALLSAGLLSPLIALIFALIPLTYHTWFIGGPQSATLGMRLMQVEVRTWDGRRPSYLQAALQTIVFYVSVGVTTWLVLLVALFNKRHRCVHDYLCGTIVIRTTEARPEILRPETG